ncbi:hydroxyethylthiazole kinase [Latilactobacillus curvatus]|uniref:Hydroxyethylthiazole kinase n=1 Tax=Latilactobacillus curvatus JCM 1096 = DSM 20019 TaxID=1293592 RepID=A0AAJ0LEK9_LATCU|nr:hydroxyethylthiazole kinase [Latilactobacillus curvatus]KRK92173.1 hydroxyethylthiazole kinase family protein [Latilactobacillus curvatus JCM 1096 = DSM 20019]MCT3531492.1 hydroxyethylthiazole kinase [Latilactobacillus curvatus]MDG2989164.1 hydroxyethylthiazole kinase [Latilactobacillus curvatus]QAS50248.1 hydroxyethylthiazole kinase [Latilactobacillus curvatus JCM 1096 = DSM 20019]GED82675.1 hydroxyethylthiazole kinase [Latilactobacillus curvatus]
MVVSMLEKVRALNPIVANVANGVTIDQVANAQNAIGASPIMSNAPEEAEGIVTIAQAITINIGSLWAPQIQEMMALMTAAYQQQKPVVLDPVAVSSLAYRQQIIEQLLILDTPTLIRGNAGEIAYFAGIDWQANGIDAGHGNSDPVIIAKAAANRLHTIILLTGPTDIITDGQRVTLISNGTSLFQTHVGSGDMLSGLCGAFVAVHPADPYQAAIEAAATFAVAGELVATAMETPLPGTFYPQLIDYLFHITPAKVANTVQLSEVPTHE